MNDFVELHRLIVTVLRRWWLLVLVTAIAATLGYVISQNQAQVYRATSTVLVGQSIKSPQLDRVDIQTSDALVQTYVEIARRQSVLEAVISALALNTTWQNLADRVTVSQVEGTQLIEINVEANSSRSARRIADEIAHQLVLISPSTEGQVTQDNPFTTFNREQLIYMQERIVNGQARLAEIDTALQRPVSEAQLAQLQAERTSLLLLLAEWEKSYTGLLTLTREENVSNQLTVIESAYSESAPIRPRVPLMTALSGGIGLLLALGLIFLLDFLDDTYKSSSDLSRLENLKNLGSIGRIKGKKYSDKIIARLEPFSPITEAYRIIRSRIWFRSGDTLGKSTIMVTSSVPQEGKSVTAANLGIVMAQSNYRTIIVDADLRNPVLHKVFNVKKEVGLGDLLSSPEVKIDDCLKKTWVNNLQVITSGQATPDPSERLGSSRMREILTRLKEIADIVIFDSPSALLFADAVVLSNQVDGVIVVIRAGKTKRSAIRQTLFDLQIAKANLLGSVFNYAPQSKTSVARESYARSQRPSRPQLTLPGVLRRKTQASFNDLQEMAVPANQEPEDSNGAQRSNHKQQHED
jgi:non-specific protein-tyrosine kinase